MCCRIIWCIYQDNVRLERVIVFPSHSCSLEFVQDFFLVFIIIILLSCPSRILCNTLSCEGTTKRLSIGGGVILSYHLCYAIGTYKTGVRWFLIFYLFIVYFFTLTYHFNFRTRVCTFFIMFDTVDILLFYLYVLSFTRVPDIWVTFVQIKLVKEITFSSPNHCSLWQLSSGWFNTRIARQHWIDFSLHQRQVLHDVRWVELEEQLREMSCRLTVSNGNVTKHDIQGALY